MAGTNSVLIEERLPSMDGVMLVSLLPWMSLVEYWIQGCVDVAMWNAHVLQIGQPRKQPFRDRSELIVLQFTANINSVLG